jgi:hypothetical protein
LGGGGRIVVQDVTKNLEMFTLVGCELIIIHHEKVNLTNIDYYYKIADKNIPSLNKLDQNINCHQQWQQT